MFALRTAKLHALLEGCPMAGEAGEEEEEVEEEEEIDGEDEEAVNFIPPFFL